MTKEEIAKKQLALASKVYSLSSGTLLINMRYMAKAISRLGVAVCEGSYKCDGRTVSFDPAHLLARYRQSERLPVHDQLHMLMHCVFRHWHTGEGLDRARWNAACDIVTEAAIMRVAADFCDNDKIAEKSAEILELSLKVRPFTAEKLYAYFCSIDLPEEKAEEYAGIFGVDNHTGWYRDPPKAPEDEEPPHISPEIVEGDKDRQPEPEDSDEPGDDPTQEGEGEDSLPPDGGDNDSGGDSGLQEYLENERRAREQQLDEEWKQMSKEIQSELENFGKYHGDESQYLVQLLEHLNRERYDYGAFLKRFAVSGEVMRADLDAFEPGFYSYGLSLYGNVALIEPPEYKETHLVRDFVIAIDTSGSVRGDLVQAFMQKTYNILKSTESFFTRVNIFIIQCDIEVREAVQITCQADLDRYIAKMELKGLGGTDFRPVFDYIDDLRGKGVLTGLKGMVYFTDGKGIFPERKPPYDAAFAFIGEPPESVPAWAVKLTLEREDIMDER